MRATLIEILLYMGLGALIMWYLIPNKVIEIPGLDKTEYEWIHDTTETIKKLYIDRIVVKPVLVETKDTLYNDSLESPINLVEEYDRITDSLVALTYGRIKYYSKITALNDTINVKLESVRDSILDLEVRLAARDIVNNQIRTIYIPKKSDTEEWWIKPSIVAGGIIVGYGLGSIK